MKRMIKNVFRIIGWTIFEIGFAIACPISLLISECWLIKIIILGMYSILLVLAFFVRPVFYVLLGAGLLAAVYKSVKKVMDNGKNIDNVIMYGNMEVDMDEEIIEPSEIISFDEFVRRHGANL